jgi:hypothetical protein
MENCDYLDADFSVAKAAQAVGFVLWIVRKPMPVAMLSRLIGDADATAVSRLKRSITGDRPKAQGFYGGGNLDALMRFNAIDPCAEWNQLLQPLWAKGDQWPSSICLRVQEMPARDLLSDTEAAILFEIAREHAFARFRGSRSDKRSAKPDQPVEIIKLRKRQ